MFIQFAKTGDLTTFLDILPRNLYQHAEVFREEATVFFFGSLNENQKRMLFNLATKLGAKIFDSP